LYCRYGNGFITKIYNLKKLSNEFKMLLNAFNIHNTDNFEDLLEKFIDVDILLSMNKAGVIKKTGNDEGYITFKFKKIGSQQNLQNNYSPAQNVITNNNNNNINNNKCPYCGETFNTKGLFIEHMMSKHN
jgi:hypothetical protein